MSAVARALRNHLPFLLITPVLTIIMTWPTAVHVFDTGELWLPTNDWDVFIEIWDAWHGSQVFAGGTELGRTEALFYPFGLSLRYHPYNVFHMLLLAWLQTILTVANAYNLIYLAFVFATALSGYLFLLYWLKDRWLALFGAVIFGFSQHVVGHPHHPASLIATLPFAIYAMHRGVVGQSWKWLAVAGALVGITVLVSIYGYLCLVLTVGMLALYFALSRWRSREFWVGLAVMFVIAGLISAVRIYPMLQSQDEFGEALAKNEGDETANDLLGSFVNYRHSTLTPIFVNALAIDTSDNKYVNGWRHTSYLGYLPLVLTLLALIKAQDRRKLLPWLFLFGLFFVLRLGSELRINDVIYSGVHLPKYYLDRLLPQLFKVVHETDHFQIGVLIPLTILSCVGLRSVVDTVTPSLRIPIILASIVLVAFEYHYVPISLTVSEAQLAFNAWLKAVPNQDEIRLINLPMGRTPSKQYGLYQALNGYPHAEGLAMRTPAASYRYIRENELLNGWSTHRQRLQCAFGEFDLYLSALSELMQDGFSHIVLHSGRWSTILAKRSLELFEPVYVDEFTEIYRLQDIYDTCAAIRAHLESESIHLMRFERSSYATRPPKATLYNVQIGGELREKTFRYFTARFSEWSDPVFLQVDTRGNNMTHLSDAGPLELHEIDLENHIVWVIYNPKQFTSEVSRSVQTALAEGLHSCQKIKEAADLTIDIYIDRDFPCELVTRTEAFAVYYDNGIQLASIMHKMEDKMLTWYLWWSDEPVRGFAYTIQLFNAGGEKVLQLDDVIRDEPLARHDMDLSSLEAGEYRADLIVYDHESGQSQPGTILSTGQTFRRELEIARFVLEA